MKKALIDEGEGARPEIQNGGGWKLEVTFVAKVVAAVTVIGDDGHGVDGGGNNGDGDDGVDVSSNSGFRELAGVSIILVVATSTVLAVAGD